MQRQGDSRVNTVMKINEIISPSDFESWFAGSQLTNPDGSPMALYHGTKAPENLEFSDRGTGERGEMLGSGIYLTNSRDYASRFGHPVPFYVSAKRLMREGDRDAEAAWEKDRRGYFDRFLGRYARQHGYDGIIGNLGIFGGIRAFQVVVFSPEQVHRVTDQI
jgi:ADP-Ribosyltransferase in polyvalent proteins